MARDDRAGSKAGRRRFAGGCLVLTLAAGAMVALAPPPEASAQETHRLPAISPVPQHERQRDDFAVLTPTVDLVAGPAADAPAVRAAEAALRAAGVRSVVRTRSGVYHGRDGRLTVWLGRASGPGVASALRGLGVGRSGAGHAEGYTLAVGGGLGRGPGEIVLAGADGAGTYYAAQSLRQILPRGGHAGARVGGLSIQDWPATRTRGVVEGFYGTPWSQSERLAQLDFYGEHKMNTYTYASKSDPYLRDKWRQPYPDKELATIKALVDRARERHVDFVYALSPGLSVCYSSDADLKALTDKFTALWNIGVRDFAVPLDDVSYTKWNCDDDARKFGSGPAAAGKAQASLLNRVDKGFIAGHPGAAPLQMVPTEYGSVTSTPYKKAIAAYLGADVVVQWTGTDVVSRTVTVATAKAARRVYGHRMLLWDNYPANDYAADRLQLGPYTGRQRGLPAHVAGILANPMIEPSASEPALATVADFAWNDRAFDPRSSWLTAIGQLAGGDRAAAHALRAFGDITYDSSISPGQGPDLTSAVRSFWRTGDAKTLRSRLHALSTAPGVLRSRLPDRDFVPETLPWLDSARDWAKADTAALDMVIAERHGRKDKARTLRASLPGLVDRAGSYHYTDVTGARVPAVVGEGVLDEFVADAVAADDAALGLPLPAKASTDMRTHQDHTPLRMTDGDDKTWYWNKSAVTEGDWVGLDLRTERPLGRITLAMGEPGAPDDIIDSGVLEYSSDGRHWKRLTGFSHTADVTFLPPAGTRARYVRARATADQDALLAVRSFDVAFVPPVQGR
ncbi:beta-N-acetylglucosaminidase domain-containing protein [Streptomyces montanisoli]|uniref:Beta-N-acetylglucosaminidase domain-containing protein n=1 Tax=Streptomyces montanisoli TaxID=2798581 RepID=A0A940MFC8_9ACTN|nr:beta-N-acetylglucosaminidase domain-containing protein [Streptomyces montanisoli]MBP0457623.1 beta-N-acetylglucosaminidase domain-containing protein [Streptomyces montanisoli]